jgi:UDP-N-acetyl-D-mannosaminuronic acid dehydrogenase
VAVDPWFIVDSAPEEARLMRMAREVNDSKPDFVVAKVKEAAGRFKEPKIACLGLSYKADIDDLRESPAVKVVGKILEAQIGKVMIVEPHINTLPNSLKKGKYYPSLVSLEESIKQSDVIVVLVVHSMFSRANFVKDLSKQKVLVNATYL